MTSDIDLNIQEEILEVPGLDRKHRIFFLADSHISLCDSRDSEVMGKAANRAKLFAGGGIGAEHRFDALINRAKESNSEVVLFGGDITDSAMYASIDYVGERIKNLNRDYLFIMGNHDFEYGSEYFSPKAYADYLPRFSEIRDAQSYHIIEKEDIIYFAADDSNNQIDQSALDAFKDEVAKGKAMVLILHVPIEPLTGDTSLVDACKATWGATSDNKSKVTLGVNGCYPNAVTSEFINLVTSKDSPVVLVLAGHVHFYHKDMLNDKVLQIVTGAGFNGEAIDITLQ